MADLQRPGGELASRPIHFFWVVDCSGSMSYPLSFAQHCLTINITHHLRHNKQYGDLDKNPEVFPSPRLL